MEERLKCPSFNIYWKLPELALWSVEGNNSVPQTFQKFWTEFVCPASFWNKTVVVFRVYFRYCILQVKGRFPLAPMYISHYSMQVKHAACCLWTQVYSLYLESQTEIFFTWHLKFEKKKGEREGEETFLGFLTGSAVV